MTRHDHPISNFELKAANTYPIPQLADLLTRGFEGYFVPISIDEAALRTMMRRDTIDLAQSRVLLKDAQPIGMALIARRGWTSRLAAMGIVSNARGGGAGTWAMEQLINEARARGEKEMVLEVIEQNTAGLKLYQKTGFKPVRRLVGYELEKPPVDSQEQPQEIEIRELAQLIMTHGLKDLPWQLSGESIAEHAAPSRAFRLSDAYCVISDPAKDRVAVSSVLVKAGSRQAAAGSALLRALFSRFPGKTWRVPALFPEEMAPVFDQVGMQRSEISQLQMSLKL